MGPFLPDQSPALRMLCKVVLALAFLSVASAQVVYGVANLCSQYGWPVGNYPHPTDCRKYLTCNGGATFEMNCPAGLAFNPNTRDCDQYANVPLCQYNGINGYYPYLTNTICAQYGWGNGNWYHPSDCTKYVQCSNGVTTVMSCPAGLTYSSALKTCAANGVSPCRQYVFVPPINVNYPANYDNYCAANNLASGIHPDPYSCLAYIECTFGVTNHMPCPAGLAFNPALLVCDDNRNVNCVGPYVPGVGKK